MFYKVKIRWNLEDGEVKPAGKQIDGKVFNFEKGWKIVPFDGLYLGETAMVPTDSNYPEDAPQWIASGDLEEIDERHIPSGGASYSAKGAVVSKEGLVSKVVDKNGNGNDLIQTDPSRQPLMVN